MAVDADRDLFARRAAGQHDVQATDVLGLHGVAFLDLLGVHEAALVVLVQAEDFDPVAGRIFRGVSDEMHLHRILRPAFRYILGVLFLRLFLPFGRELVFEGGGDEERHGNVERLQLFLDVLCRL